ncbi:MAG: hypothetical protein IH899_11015 [Planctomycetes bacterium]|nr:hypothetical protein [Planctomycetota bacterium]
MNDPIRKAFDVICVPLQILGRIMPPLYHFNLVSVPVGLILAAMFYGLLALSGVLAWRSSSLE